MADARNNVSSPSMKKVFIQRDYTEGTNIRFQTTFPQELDGLVSFQMKFK